MLDNGYELIKKNGYKKTSVEEIAKSCSIAKGTFYNFFTSKEEFLYQIMILSRDRTKVYFESLLEETPLLSRNRLKLFIEYMLHADTNVFDYLTSEDLAKIQSKWPTEYFLNENNDEKTSTWILSHVEVKQNNCNWKVFANYLKALAIVNSKNDLLHQDVLNITMDCLISDILDYVYES
ncbi:TetR/AcrR family transcriptional regulator [Clostridium estertheticum]|uniref:TetR/AcrR family transcriptional regulator n=1 Tax=Clostridium estertheticum TaxID=238834 RepID=UPI001CF30AD0|nr:TetR/AcrR family transcriptional regulator [Clostridium estertheticum]MCB2342628.1 TetR/AcrR family transcriptional regulator [Clostridium estertheticum]